MEFGRNTQRTSGGRHSRRRPPPNYFARSVQVRLLVVVATLMLVLLMMMEARKPENWSWLWGGATRGQQGEQVDTQLPDSSAPPDPSALGMVTGVRTVELAESKGDAAVLRSKAWQHVLESLSHDSRLELERLLAAAAGDDMPRVDPSGWGPAFDRLAQAWDDYLAAADAALSGSSGLEAARDETQRVALADELERLGRHWRESLRPMLRAPLDDRPWTASERELLLEVRRMVDEVSLRQVRDDTVSRPAEQYAWFRLLGQLQQQPLETLQRRAQQVSFVQLFRQPATYRGNLVTIRGIVRLAYRVPAPQNIYDISHYYVLWLKPEGGQLSPFLVYSLHLPEGFPEVADKYQDGKQTELSEPVQVTGYFFKRQAYRARDGVNTAPLVLAKVPDWSPSPVTAVPTLPTPLALGLGVAALALLAAGLAGLAYRSSNRVLPHTSRPRLSEVELEALQRLDQQRDIKQALRELAQREDSEQR